MAGDAGWLPCGCSVPLPQGMVKLIFDKNTGIILGVHIIGQDACELIHYGMELVVQVGPGPRNRAAVTPPPPLPPIGAPCPGLSR